MASLGVILGGALLAVGAGIALATIAKPEEHLASGHLAGLHMGRHARHTVGGKTVATYAPWGEAWGGFDDSPQVIITPNPSQYGYVYFSGVPSAQGERLVPFSIP